MRPSKAADAGNEIQRSATIHQEVLRLLFRWQHVLRKIFGEDPFRRECKPLAVATIFNAMTPAVPYTLILTKYCISDIDYSQAATTLPLSTIIVLSSCFSVSPYSTLFHVTIRASFMSNSNTLTRLRYPPYPP